MPPKAKFHQDKGKLRVLPKPSTSTGPNLPPPIALDEEAQQQFEVELYWCVQQLQNSLASNKLNNRQIEDATKHLKILTSKSTSVVQKRQLMRQCFGDYRKKMSDEEKKFKKVNEQTSIKMLAPTKSSTFVKKSVFKETNSNFKFNFKPLVEDEQTASDNINSNLEKLDLKETKFHFEPSANAFRFNFADNN